MQNDNPYNQPDQSQVAPDLDYDFILNPNTPKKRLFNFNSSKSQVLVIAVSLLLLIIVFIVLKNLLSSPVFSSSDFLAVLRDQQSIMHVISLDTTTNQEVGLLSNSNKNLVATTALVITSDNQNTLNYLKNNGVTFSPSTLNLGINPALDNQINSSLNANDYNQTLDQVLSELFTNYVNDLKITYRSERGPKGKALLKTAYHDVYLLDKSLST